MQGTLETPIRYRRALWNLCVDEDATDIGFVEVLVDDDETLLLVSQGTFDTLSALGRLGDLFGLLVEPSAGYRALPSWMLTPALAAVQIAPVSLVEDVVRYLEQADPDAGYCVGAPHCLQDVVSRDRGFPLCAIHHAQMGEVDALLMP